MFGILLAACVLTQPVPDNGGLGARRAELEGAALEAKDFRVCFNQAGGITRFVHLPSGQVLVSAERAGPAYELSFQNAKGVQKAYPRPDQVRLVQTAAGLRFVAEDERARVTMTYQLGEGGLMARVDAENQTQQALIGVRFPILRFPEKLGSDGTDDRLLFPLLDGGQMDDPGTTPFRGENGLEMPGYGFRVVKQHGEVVQGCFRHNVVLDSREITF